MSLILGIDEAGKGPVIGNMFVAGVVIDKAVIVKLKHLGVRDSKLLSPYMREAYYSVIKKAAKKIYVKEVGVEEIDRRNINKILADKYVEIVKEALRDFENIEEIVIDLPSMSPEKLKSRIRLLNFRGKIVTEHFADKKYVVVSAASIVAKVYREKHIEALRRMYGDFGSGYPSDEKTISWIKEFYLKNGFLPNIVRKSWKTIKNIAPKEYVKKK
ncbi:MAG: ribonuclease HII [Thermoprotei archaeon]|nr:ribonuclease HII [Thermoprotei archaeon]